MLDRRTQTDAQSFSDMSTVSECCGSALTDKGVCVICQRLCEGASQREPMRSCAECWQPVDLQEWQGCHRRFCPCWDSLKQLSGKELEEAESKPYRKDLSLRPYAPIVIAWKQAAALSKLKPCSHE